MAGVPNPPNPPEQSKPPQNPTRYARLYGESQDPLFQGTRKSGLTPIIPPDLKTESPKSKKSRKKYELFQRKNLRTWTSWELLHSGCLEEVAKNPNLNIPILPMLHRQNWIKGKVVRPIGDGYEGNWDCSSEDVWEVLKPILKLVTLLVNNSDMWLWFDALMYGQRKKVDPETIVGYEGREKPEIYSFHRRDPATADRKDSVVDVLNNPERKFRFSIGDADLNGDGGPRLDLDGAPMKAQAFYRPVYDIKGKYRSAQVYIVWQNLEPLLKKTLSTSQLLVQQFAVAASFLHEFAHATAAYAASLPETLSGPEIGKKKEPFFEDEEINEAGWSSENAVWGGTLDPMQSNEGPRMAMVLSSFVSYKHFRPRSGALWEFRHPERFGDGAVAEFWGVQIRFMENLHRREYWEVQVPKFRTEALKPRKICGYVYTKKDSGKNSMYATTGPDYAAWQEETGRSFDTSNCDHQVFKYGEPTTLEYAAQKRTENILKAMNVQPVLGKRPAPQPDSPSLPPKKARRFDLVPGSEDSP